MEIFRCEQLEGKIISKRPCLYERDKIQRENKTCQRCPYYQNVILPKERLKKDPGRIEWTFETFIKNVGLQEWEKFKSKPHGQYWIDPRLEVKKDFPEELTQLFKVFNDEIPFYRMEVKKNHLTQLEPYLEELTLLEKTFRDFYLQPSMGMVVRCVEITRVRIRSCPDNFPNLYRYWTFLENIIHDKRVSELLHQCPWCEIIFLSRQKKKYHDLKCKQKFESSKRGPEAMRRSRKRKQKMAKKK